MAPHAMLWLRRLVILALAIAVIWAAVEFVRSNEAAVSVDLLWVDLQAVSLWMALLVAFAAGAVAAGLVGLFEVARYGLVARRYRKTVARLEAEIHQLRNLPLAEEGATPSRGSGDPGYAAPPGGPAPSRG